MIPQRKLIVAIAAKLSLDGGVMTINDIQLYHELLAYVINNDYMTALNQYTLYGVLYTPTIDTLFAEWSNSLDKDYDKYRNMIDFK